MYYEVKMTDAFEFSKSTQLPLKEAGLLNTATRQSGPSSSKLMMSLVNISLKL